MPDTSARFASVEPPLNDSKLMTALQKDFKDWLFRNSAVKARANTALKVFAGPDVSQADFMKACADAARDARDSEISRKTAPIDRKLKTLEDRLAREERELREDEAKLQARRMEAGANLLELGAGLAGLGRKKSVSTQFTKQRMKQQAKLNVQESIESIAKYKKEIADLQREREDLVREISDRWGHVVNDIEEVNITPKKTDIYVNLFGLAWKPFYIIEAGGESFELPAFGAE
jgi:hypothetical protein